MRLLETRFQYGRHCWKEKSMSILALLLRQHCHCLMPMQLTRHC